MSTWSFVLPGQPPSWNNSYRIGTATGIDSRGREYERPTIVKREKAELWQAQMVLIVRSARPSGWAPKGWVRVVYRPFLTRRIDMDNLLKMTHDVIEAATGVNDRWFLPCFPEPPVVGVAERFARLEVTVDG